MRVYVNFDSKRKSIRSIYADKEMALLERNKINESALAIIDTYSYELKGFEGRNFDTFRYPINDYCNYYTDHLEILRSLISALYDLDGCACGGLGHVVIDEDNIDDESIKSTIEYCDEEQNKDRNERGLVKLICEELLKLSMQERVLLFSTYYGLVNCNNDCENCNIYKGILKRGD